MLLQMCIISFFFYGWVIMYVYSFISLGLYEMNIVIYILQ